MVYPLVICYIAIENGSLEWIFPLIAWWFSTFWNQNSINDGETLIQKLINQGYFFTTFDA